MESESVELGLERRTGSGREKE